MRQIEKIDHWAKQLANGKVSILFDCEPTGDNRAKESLWFFADRELDVRLGWSQGMHGGNFAGKQPETLSPVDWHRELSPTLER